MKVKSRKAAIQAADKTVKDRHKGEPKQPKSAQAKAADKEARVASKVKKVKEGKATGVGLAEFDGEATAAAPEGATLMEAAGASMPTPKAARVPKAPKEPKAPRTDGLPELPSMPGAGAKERVARARKVREMHPCACGCGTPCKATWAPGHDARAKGWALRIERGMLTIDQVPENEQAGANRMLTERAEAASKAAEVPAANGGLKLVPKAEGTTEAVSE